MHLGSWCTVTHCWYRWIKVCSTSQAKSITLIRNDSWHTESSNPIEVRVAGWVECLSRTLERQMILNWNFVTLNIFLWWIKCWKSFFKKICQLSVMTVLSRAFDDFFYVFPLRSKFYWKLYENFFKGKF